jgi:hypothetical protein
MGVHLSGVVGAIALIPAATAFFFRRVLPLSASFLLWHIAGTGFAVSIASSGPLAKHTTWVLGKGKDGSISTFGFMLFWPYHIGLRLKLALQRRISSEPTWNQVTKLVYIGAWPSDETLLPSMRHAVLDVTCELPCQVRPRAYKMIPVWDTHSAFRYLRFIPVGRPLVALSQGPLFPKTIDSDHVCFPQVLLLVKLNLVWPGLSSS